MMQPFQKSPPQLWVCLFIFFVTLAVYGQILRFDFVEYDDPEYVSENPHVRAGITTEGLIWAFTSGHAGNWHPLTWISHMVDCQLFGLTSGMHHITNLLLHIANSLLLFLLLAPSDPRSNSLLPFRPPLP